MRKVLLGLGIMTFISSCGFNGNRQEEKTVQEEVSSEIVQEKPDSETPLPGQASQDSPEKVPSDILEKGKGLLKDLLGALAEEMRQQAEEDDDAAEESQYEDVDESPQLEGKWYDRDFAMTIQSYTYSLSGKHDPSSDTKHVITRTGNTVRVRTEEASGTIVETVCDFTADGKRHVKQYMNGKLARSHSDDRTAGSYLLNWMTQEDHGPLNYHPDVSNAQSQTTLCGRRVGVVETEVDENLLGVRKHIEKKYYIDRQYDFLYKVSKSGGTAGVNLQDVVLWEVTAFTDKPNK